MPAPGDHLIGGASRQNLPCGMPRTAKPLAGRWSLQDKRVAFSLSMSLVEQGRRAGVWQDR